MLVIITRQSRLSGGCIYSPDSRMGVIPMLMIPVAQHIGNTNIANYKVKTPSTQDKATQESHP